MPPSQDIVPAQPDANKSNALVPYQENGRDMIVASAQKALARPLSSPETFIFTVSQSLANWISGLNAEGYPVGFTIGAPKQEGYKDDIITYSYQGTFTLNRQDKPPTVIGKITINERDSEIKCVIPKIVDTNILVNLIECTTTHRRWFGLGSRMKTRRVKVMVNEFGPSEVESHITDPARISSWETGLYKVPSGCYFRPINSSDAERIPFESLMSAWIKTAVAPNIVQTANDFTGIEVRPHYKATPSTTPHL